MPENNMFGPLLDPNGLQYQIERQQALYQALAQQAMTPQQGQMVSGHYIAPAFGGLGSIGQALIAKNLSDKIPEERSQLSQTMAGNLSRMFGGQQQQQVIQPPNPNPVPVPSTQDVLSAPNITNASANMGLANAQNAQNTPPPITQPTPTNGPNLANLLKVGMASSAFGPEAGTAVGNWLKPTDASLLASQGNMDPVALNRAMAFKTSQPEAYRPGSIVPSQNGTMQQLPVAPPSGFMNVQNNGQWQTQPMPGGLPAVQASSQAQAGGQAAGTAPYKFQTITPAGQNNPLLVSDAQLAAGVGKPGGLAIQSPAQADIEKAKGEAAVNAAKTTAALSPLLQVIQQAKAISPSVPEGTYGKLKVAAQESSPQIFGSSSADAANTWNQMMGQSILNTIKNLQSNGSLRMDIPIVHEIENAGGIPAYLPASTRMRMLNQLESEVKNSASASQNIVPQLNQANPLNTSVNPMINPVTTKIINGKAYINDGKGWLPQ